ncbi:MAG TPA: aminotransferase class I/II-fold pyridoxal phosphate-dependent enzyme [Pyrinomonadaceae bacterium]|nr:aminotransferase class I/II-fold pyridoxal phosphate-dependent enzyme [Pyrinomonadaceae bacterium]
MKKISEGRERTQDSHEQDQPGERERPARPSSLDISEEAMGQLSAAVVALVTDYFGHISELPIFPDTSAEKIAEALSAPLPTEGEPLEKLIEDCRTIIGASRHNGHPRFFGYVASPSTPVGAYADLIASALNQNVTSWRSAPAATLIEKQVLRWLGQCIGCGEDAQGLLTSGGSQANLNALLIAHRTKAAGDVSSAGLWNAGAPMTVYTSDQAHSSIAKAADILGLGRDYVRLVKTEADFRLDVRALREQLEADTAQGLRPFCIVGNAGTVTTGAIDPLALMADIAAERDLWFHVDGAYGAPGMLDQKKRPLFAGMERADSVSLDAHKWLYSPVDCGCLLLRDAGQARAAFNAGEVNYIKIHEQTEDESFAFWDYGVELSRRFRALKVWMMLRYYGVARVAAAISEDNVLAAYLAEAVNDAEDFELLAPVTLSICCFRYVPQGWRDKLNSSDEEERAALKAQLDLLNTRIMHTVQRGGRAYLSNATLNGSFALRACITNFHTTRADIRETLDIIRDVGATAVTSDE